MQRIYFASLVSEGRVIISALWHSYLETHTNYINGQLFLVDETETHLVGILLYARETLLLKDKLD